MNAKKYEIAVWGEQLVLHKRQLRIEVPDDVTEDEIDLMESNVLHDVQRGSDWWIEDAGEISESIETVDFVRSLDENVPVHARLVRNDRGKLVLAD